jgi:hypothetical protein
MFCYSPIVSSVHVLFINSRYNRLVTKRNLQIQSVSKNTYIVNSRYNRWVTKHKLLLLLTDCTWSLCFITHRLYQEYMFCYSLIVPGVCFVTHRLYLEFMFYYSPIVPGVYVLLLTNIIFWYNQWVIKHKLQVQSVSNKTKSRYNRWVIKHKLQVQSVSNKRVCFVTHRLYLEFMFYYSPIVPGVYVLLLTNCTWSLCFVTHRLYLEFMFCYSRYNRWVTKQTPGTISE